jgi:hypothetical protein
MRGRLKERQEREREIIKFGVTTAAITHAGGRQQSVPVITTDGVVDAADHFIELWNRGVRLINECFGDGYFGLGLERTLATHVRLRELFPGGGARSYTLLLYLETTDKEPDPLIGWMLDFLFAAGLPEGCIIAESARPGGLWDSKLRKTKFGMAAKEEAARQDRIAEAEEKQWLRAQGFAYVPRPTHANIKGKWVPFQTDIDINQIMDRFSVRKRP